MRETFKQSETHRIVRFYDERFASSADNVVSAYSTMADGLDALGLTNIGMSESILKKAAGTDKLPDKQEAEVSARAFAAFSQDGSSHNALCVGRCVVCPHIRCCAFDLEFLCQIRGNF